MKIGVMIQPRSLAQTGALAQVAEASGFSWLGVADSPAVWGESYLHQLQALQVTERLHVGPMVTHVVIRHPLIVANALSTLVSAGGGRVLAAIGTGNSAARGLGLPPASLATVAGAVQCVRAWWAGEAGTFDRSRIPATGLRRPGCPLLVAADGPRGAQLASEVGDGFVFGGGLDDDLLRQRVALGRRHPGQVVWVAPSVSLGASRDEVIADMGPQMVAMANRALRGDLTVQGVPVELHPAVRALRDDYDYGFHADPERPRNVGLAERSLTDYLVDRMVLWGDEDRWGHTLGRLRDRCDGVMLVLGQSDPLAAVRAIADRLRRLGYLEAGSASA
jgi:alkanesulfonate monooxygenase SsuD/methylene tetrahydromethanopterin reductase-like flavin-dependent oxidoreductase (luciferase family)